jgi:hypothetical protein
MKTSERIATMPESTQALIRELAAIVPVSMDAAKKRFDEWLKQNPKCRYWEQLAIIEQSTALAQENEIAKREEQ